KYVNYPDINFHPMLPKSRWLKLQLSSRCDHASAPAKFTRRKWLNRPQREAVVDIGIIQSNGIIKKTINNSRIWIFHILPLLTSGHPLTVYRLSQADSQSGADHV